MTKVTISLDVLLGTHPTHQQVQQIAMGAVLCGTKVDYQGDNVVYFIEPRRFPLDYAKLAVSVGATVERYPLFIECNPSDLVPKGIQNSVNEGGDQITWNEWRNDTHTFLERDGRTFLGTNANDNSDIPLHNLTPVLDSLVHPNDLPAPLDPNA